MKLFSTQFIYFSILGLAVAIGFSSMQKDPSNPPTAQTGAPGETTCSTASGCHSGGAFAGTSTLTGVPDTIKANTDYNLTITLKSACTRTGFQITCLDNSNTKCGTFTAGTGNNVSNTTTRQYVRQSSAKTLSGGSANYVFKWKSPASITKDTAYFYFAMLQANGNGNTSGDNVAKGVKKVVMEKSNATNELSIEESIQVYPNPSMDFVKMTLPEGTFNVTIYTLSGNVLAKHQLSGGTQTIDTKQLPAGNYLFHISGKDVNLTKKVSKLERI